jgi:hypothetical protein
MPNCDICGLPSNGYECDWPVEQFVEVPLVKVKVGDVVAALATVVSIERRFRARYAVHVTLSIKAPGKPERLKTFACPDWHVLHARRRMVCGARICDACMIERDPEKMVICAKHWHAWELIA